MALDDFTLDDDPPANARAPAPAQGDDAAGAEREAEAVEAAALSGGAHHPASALTEPAGRDGAAEAAGGEAGGPATEEGGEAPPGGGLQQARPQTVQKIQELDHVLDEVYAQARAAPCLLLPFPAHARPFLASRLACRSWTPPWRSWACSWLRSSGCSRTTCTASRTRRGSLSTSRSKRREATQRRIRVFATQRLQRFLSLTIRRGVQIINTDLNTQAISAKLDKLASFMMASYQNEGLR